jgi:hypothetical protein
VPSSSSMTTKAIVSAHWSRQPLPVHVLLRVAYPAPMAVLTISTRVAAAVVYERVSRSNMGSDWVVGEWRIKHGF